MKKSTPPVVYDPKTENQKEYYRAMASRRIVICTGPPGTGKTLTALSYAASTSKNIIITRPMVEACGEELGFLPGDIANKMFPYLYVFDQYIKEMQIEKSRVERWPLAFMRGLSLKNKIVILDEAQNASYDQLKMLLTRIGEGTKIIVNGDVEQSDIQSDTSAMLSVADRLNGQPWFRYVEMDEDDILRDPIVKDLYNLL